MNPDEFKLTFAGLLLYHPPLPRFQQNELPDLFAKLTKNYRLETFRTRGDTEAIFRTEGERLVHIERDSLHVDIHAAIQFDRIRREFSDIASTIKEGLGMTAFAIPQTQLRLLWPLPPGSDRDVTQVMQGQVINLKSDQYSLLKAASVDHISITIDVEMNSELSRSITIEPYESDPSQISIELNSIRHMMVENVSVIERWVEEDYNYLTHQVTAFVQTFMP